MTTEDSDGVILKARKVFHANLLKTILVIDKNGVPSIADKSQVQSVEIARYIAERLNAQTRDERSAGQTSGNGFEAITTTYLRDTFLHLGRFRPGTWTIEKITGKRKEQVIARYGQFAHLKDLADAAAKNRELAAALGNDYAIKPDVVIFRHPETRDTINAHELILNDGMGTKTALMGGTKFLPFLHASVSCKWTMRSDRAQNARSEALNYIRNRKGRLPHIVAVTAEPTPARLSSLALGTGDIDCTYHAALNELEAAVADIGNAEAQDTLAIMLEGERLKDISDLPLDLAV